MSPPVAPSGASHHLPRAMHARGRKAQGCRRGLWIVQANSLGQGISQGILEKVGVPNDAFPPLRSKAEPERKTKKAAESRSHMGRGLRDDPGAEGPKLGRV